MIQFSRQVGKKLQRPVAAVLTYNGSTYTAANNTDVAATVDTVVRDDGPLYNGSGTNEHKNTVSGWWVTFFTSTYTAWLSGAGNYRSQYSSISNLVTAGDAGAGSTLETFHTGSVECSTSACGLFKVSAAGGANNHGVTNQASFGTRTLAAACSRFGTMHINAINSLGAIAYNSTTQAYTANVEATSQHDSTVFDEASFWSSGANTKLTVPTGMGGWYLIGGGLTWATSGSTNSERRASIQLGGSTRLATQTNNSANGTKQNNVFALYYLAAADYVELLGMAEQSVSTSTISSTRASAHFRLLMVNKDDYPGACITRTSTQSVAQNANDVAAFNSSVRDNWGMSQIGGSNPERLTVPTGQDGWYMAVGNARWTTSAEGQRRVGIYINANSQWEARHSMTCNSTSTDDPGLPVGALMYLVGGDYVTMKIENISTVQANTTQANQVFLSLVKVQQ